MKINIFPIVSSLHSQEVISNQTKELLEELKKESGHEINIVDASKLYDADLSLILIQSGGSEQLILENIDKLHEPFYLLTYGTNNSLAASLEILSYLKDNNLKGEVLHGSNSYLVKRINQLLENKEYRYGVIGHPSDWLIASNVDYKEAKRLHNISLIDIDINKVIDYYKQVDQDVDASKYDFNQEEVKKALVLKRALDKIVEENKLDGLTIRCFSILNPLKTTACLGLSLLNKDKIIGTCEGDIPSMISMHVLKKVTGQVGFQANPSRIDVENKKIIFAHCTLPFDMSYENTFKTHFESNSGVAIKGKLKEGKVTIFKLSRNLKDYFVETGTLVRNLDEENLCRTQIEIKLDDNISYFLTRPYGNHHLIIYGDHKQELIDYMSKIS